MEKVLNYLRSLWPLESLSLKFLSLKLVALLALTTAERSQTLQFLDISKMKFGQDGVSFQLDKLTKTDKPGKFRTVFVPVLHNDQNVCAVKTLEFYLKYTEKLRKSNQLFVSFKRPHLAVTSSTLARWLITVLSFSGIDSNFKAHSFRSATTSAKFRKGASIKDIMKLASWKNAQTFRKFYYKPVDV